MSRARVNALVLAGLGLVVALILLYVGYQQQQQCDSVIGAFSCTNPTLVWIFAGVSFLFSVLFLVAFFSEK